MTDHTHFSEIYSTALHSTTNKPLRELVSEKLAQYFSCADSSSDMPPRQLYALVLEEVERPLLEVAMRFVKNNQCKAAEMLGISRTNLRKKLKQYGMLKGA